MAKPKQTTKPNKIKSEEQPVETVPDKAPPRALPYSLERELEEIQKNTGRVIDLDLPVEELEKICNQANSPASSWRDRW
jgi:hypothetical protein